MTLYRACPKPDRVALLFSLLQRRGVVGALTGASVPKRAGCLTDSLWMVFSRWVLPAMQPVPGEATCVDAWCGDVLTVAAGHTVPLHVQGCTCPRSCISLSQMWLVACPTSAYIMCCSPTTFLCCCFLPAIAVSCCYSCCDTMNTSCVLASAARRTCKMSRIC